MRQTTSKFIAIKCTKCKNEQRIFTKAASIVNCLVCNEVLATPTGGSCKVKASK